MLTRRIIPCLDVDRGRVVKGIKFEQIRDAGDPVECAVRYQEEGADELVFLDITATRERRGTFVELVERISERVFIPFTVGGGVRSLDDMRALLLAGADKVAINSAAVRQPALIGEAAERFGNQCVVLAVDARRRPSAGEGGSAAAPTDAPIAWEVFVAGGSQPTGLDALEWIAQGVARGAGEILLTSMDRDGTLAGYDIELLQRVTGRVRVPVIASGGAGTLEHLAAAFIEGRAHAVLAASILHVRQHTVGEAKAYLAARGLLMREGS